MHTEEEYPFMSINNTYFCTRVAVDVYKQNIVILPCKMVEEFLSQNHTQLIR